MIGKLLATTALLLVVTGAANAQNAAPGGMLASGYQMTSTDMLASKLIGSGIYSTIATSNGAANNSAANTAATTTTTTNSGNTAANANGAPAANAGDTNAQKIGTVRDLVLNGDGKVAAVVIGIGGVLGIGEKNVAVAYQDVRWAVAQDGGVRGTIDTTADALKSAPDFVYPDNKQASNAGAANTTTTNMAANNAPATDTSANNVAANNPPANNTAATTNNNADVNVANLKPTTPDAIKADNLKGIDVINPAGQKIASIDDFVLTKDGKVDAVIIDFGGFLGIGTKQIALAFEGLKFMDDPNGKHYLVVNLTKEQLQKQRAYDPKDYAANRDAERLVTTQ